MIALVALTFLVPALAGVAVVALTPLPRRRAPGGLTVLAVALLLALPAALAVRALGGLGWLVALGLELVPAALAISHVRHTRRLAGLIDRLRDPDARRAAMGELTGWLTRLRERWDRGHVAPHAYDAGLALVDLGLYDEAEEVLSLADFTPTWSFAGARVRLLAAVAAIGRGDGAAARRWLRAAGGSASPRLHPMRRAVRALLAALDGDDHGALAELRGMPERGGDEITEGVAALARAHALARRGDEDGAVAAVDELPDAYARALALELARAASGPASPHLAKLEQPSSAYR